MKKYIFWSGFILIFTLSILSRSCKEGIVLDIKKLTYDNNKIITVGRNLDVPVDALKDTLSLKFLKSGNAGQYNWQLTGPVYLKLNGITLNKYNLDAVSKIEVRCGGKRISISREQIIAETERFNDDNDGVRYVSLKDIVNKINGPENYEFIKDSVKSVISCDDAETKPCIVILDKHTQLTLSDGSIAGFTSKGTVQTDAESNLSLQFFKVYTSELYGLKDPDHHFNIGNISYQSTVKPIFTSYGASEIILQGTDSQRISFNKHYRSIIPAEAMDSARLNCPDSQKILVKQKAQAVFAKNALYIDNYSPSVASPIGLFDNQRGFQLLTAGNPVTDKEFRVYPINFNLFFTGFLPLLLMAIIVFCWLRFILTKSSNIYETAVSTTELDDVWKPHYFLLLGILFCLGLGRLLVGYNLSYTSPYFTFAFPTAVAVAPLIILLVGVIWTIFLLAHSKYGIQSALRKVKTPFRVLFSLFPFLSILLLNGYIEANFPFYMDEFKNELRKTVTSRLFSGNLDDSPVFVLTLSAILFLGLILWMVLLFLLWRNSTSDKNKPPKNIPFFKIPVFWAVTTIVSVWAVVFFVLGGNSYSAGLLLVVIYVIYFNDIFARELGIRLPEAISRYMFDKKIHAVLLILFLIVTYIIFKSFGIIIYTVLAIVLYCFGNRIITKQNNINESERLTVNSRIKTALGFIFKNALIMLLIFLVAAGVKSDSGYIINIYFFILLLPIILLYRSGGTDNGFNYERKLKKPFVLGMIITILWLIAVSYSIFSGFSNSFDVNKQGRLESRAVSFFDFSKVHEAGVRKSEMQAQFFAEMAKYTYPAQTNSFEPIHPGISSFVDPVVKNDLSVPFGLIYPFGSGWWWPVLLYASMLFALLFYVFKASVIPLQNNQGIILSMSKFALIRLFCATVLVGSGIYLLASYYNIVPFTGRLIFGMGQDSIAEVFETMLLFSFMGLVGVQDQ